MIDGLADLLVFDFAVAGTAEIIGEIVAPHQSVTALRLLAVGYRYVRGDSPVQSPPNVVATREEFAALAVDVRLPAKVLYWKYPVSLSTVGVVKQIGKSADLADFPICLTTPDLLP